MLGAPAPRAPFTLPANPFAGLDARDLGSFVECTLYEADLDAEDIDRLVRAPRPAARPAPEAAAPTVRRTAPRPRRAPRLALGATGALVGLAAALIVSGRTAVGGRPAVPQPCCWAVPKAMATSPASSPPPPPTAPVVEPIGPELQADPPPPPPARESSRRPRPAILIIGSSPPGAEIAVDGEPRGTTPVRLEVPRYRQVEIEASLPGYRPWKKGVYVRQAETRVGTSLTPAGTVAADDDPATP